MSKEAMKLALDELKHIKQWCLRSIGIGLVNENVLAALEEALAKQEQGEPVAWMRIDEMKAMPALEKEAWLSTGRKFDKEVVEDYTIPLYTTPYVPTGRQQRKPLTDEQLMIALLMVDPETKRLPAGFRAFARAIEAAHGIKENT